MVERSRRSIPGASPGTLDESFDLSVSRIDSAPVRRGDAACFRLGSEGSNPCIREILVADPAVLTSDTDLIHSLAFDWDGRRW
jgi:hypothetical protein